MRFDLKAPQDSLVEARAKIQPDLEKLKSAPEDPAANSAVGAYYCFRAGRWDLGLAFLAHGSDQTIKRLAIDELANSADADAVSALAEAWWGIAPSQSEPCRPGILRHAADLYSRVLDKLVGLKLTVAQKRIDDARSSNGDGTVNLLALSDPARDAMNGDWRLEAGRLINDAGGSLTRIEFPYVPSGEYDFVMTFEVVTSGDVVGPVLSARGHQFSWFVGANSNTVCGFELVNGQSAGANRSSVSAKQWLAVGNRSQIIVKVRKDKVEGYLNGRLVSSLKTDYAELSLYGNYALKHPDTLGLINVRNNLKIESAEVTEISGPGHLAR